MLACPFHIPRYEWGKTVPFMRKCDMCYDRLRQNRQPACVEACPHGALTFGTRDDLLKKAQAIIAAEPRKYQPHVWGETEFGGTSVMYISDVGLDRLGWPAPETGPIPALTEPLISKTPFIGLSVAVGLVGINWIVRRRMKLAGEDARREDDHHE
jgi:formate dehydrogenase iron-sulfur subunit